MRNGILETLRTYIVENFLLGDDSGLDCSESLLQSGVVDSTGVLELVVFVEETYGITVMDEEMVPDNFDTIQNLAGFVQRKRAGSGFTGNTDTDCRTASSHGAPLDSERRLVPDPESDGSTPARG